MQDLINSPPLNIFDNENEILKRWNDYDKPSIDDLYQTNKLPFSGHNFKINSVREFVNISYGNSLEHEFQFGRYYAREEDGKSYINWGELIESMQGEIKPGPFFNSIIQPNNQNSEIEESQEL